MNLEQALKQKQKILARIQSRAALGNLVPSLDLARDALGDAIKLSLYDEVLTFEIRSDFALVCVAALDVTRCVLGDAIGRETPLLEEAQCEALAVAHCRSLTTLRAAMETVSALIERGEMNAAWHASQRALVGHS